MSMCCFEMLLRHDVGSAGRWHGSLENQADAYVACTVGKSQSWTVGPLNECYNWELQKRQQKHTDCLTWNLRIMISKGISYSRVPFSGSMLNFGWVYDQYFNKNINLFFLQAV